MTRTFALLVMAALMLAAPALAVETKIFGDSARKDFAAGEMEDVYIDDEDRIVLAPERTALMKDVDYAWCAAVAGDGAVYVGTVPDGDVHKVSGGKADVFFETGEAGVFSLAVLGDGTVVAGTGADGKVYSISPSGEGEVLADLEGAYVFGLAVEPGGSVLAATGGGSGKVWRLQKGSEPQLVYESPSKHLMAVAHGAGGLVYAASGDRGAIYEINSEGRARVLFAAKERVVQDIAVGDDGSVYAATAALGDGDDGSEEAAVKLIINELYGKNSNGGSSPSPTVKATDRKYRATNAIYRIYPDGQVRVIMGLQGGLFTSLLCRGESILAATAGKPGVFSVKADGSGGTRLFKAENAQVLDLAQQAGGAFVAAFGMPGEAAVFGPDLARSGRFTSRVIAADGLTRWGTLSWRGESPKGTKLTIMLRGGNTPEVDATWTDWRVVEAPDGSGESGLPPSRFIQYRAELKTAAKDATASLESVSMAGLPINLPPVVSAISAAKDGDRDSAKPSSSNNGASDDNSSHSPPAPALSGVVAISWKAKDPNDDKLEYTLAFRDEAMKTFVTLEEEISQERHAWDTTSVPDGRYYFDVTASDRPSNTAGTELSGNRTEGPFTVDNTRPQLSQPAVSGKAGSWTLKVTATDESSTIESASYSVDGGEWKPLLPDDGIFDSRSETVSVTVSKPDCVLAVVRVADRAGNTAAARAVFEERN